MTAARLAEVFAGADRFATANCHGLWEMFDPAEPDEDPDDLDYRHTAAVALCEHCPAREPCAELLASLPRAARAGVWAGRVRTPSTRTTPTGDSA